MGGPYCAQARALQNTERVHAPAFGHSDFTGPFSQNIHRCKDFTFELAPTNRSCRVVHDEFYHLAFFLGCRERSVVSFHMRSIRKLRQHSCKASFIKMSAQIFPSTRVLTIRAETELFFFSRPL